LRRCSSALVREPLDRGVKLPQLDSRIRSREMPIDLRGGAVATSLPCDRLTARFFARPNSPVQALPHQVRGRTTWVARQANDDTFHFTKPSSLLDTANKEDRRISLFTDAIFTADDPVHEGRERSLDSEAAMPRSRRWMKARPSWKGLRTSRCELKRRRATEGRAMNRRDSIDWTANRAASPCVAKRQPVLGRGGAVESWPAVAVNDADGGRRGGSGSRACVIARWEQV
jgi:hypothetical protein